MLSPGIAERAPQPYLLLNDADAQALGLKEGESAQITMNEQAISLPVHLEASLPRGLAGLPVGLPNAPKLELPEQNISVQRMQPEGESRQ